MDVDEAARRLRKADPAADLDGMWHGSEAAQLAQQRGLLPERRRRVPVLLAAGAAAAVVAAVAIGVSLLPHPDRTVAGGGPTVQTPSAEPSSTLLPTGDPREQTDALLTQFLTGVAPLPGATPSVTSPDPALLEAVIDPSTTNGLEHRMWWTAPGSVEAALDFYRTNPPDGLDQWGSGSEHNTHTGGIDVESLLFGRPDTDFARDLGVSVSVIATDGGVAVGAYAHGVWLPNRDPAFTIAGATSIDVTVRRTAYPGNEGRVGAATVQSTLDGAAVEQLTDIVNGLPVELPGARHCPSVGGDFVDTLDFATPDGPVHVVDTMSGCRLVMITLPGGQHGLFASGNLDATLMQLLGLPDNYGYN